MQCPRGVTVDGEHVFVAYCDGRCIKVFTRQGGQFVREGRGGAANGAQEMRPWDLTVSDGVLYATEKSIACVAVLEG